VVPEVPAVAVKVPELAVQVYLDKVTMAATPLMVNPKEVPVVVQERLVVTHLVYHPTGSVVPVVRV